MEEIRSFNGKLQDGSLLDFSAFMFWGSPIVCAPALLSPPHVFPLCAGTCWPRRSFVCSCTGTWHKPPTALGLQCVCHTCGLQSGYLITHFNKIAILLPEARGRKSWNPQRVLESEGDFSFSACQMYFLCKLQSSSLLSLSCKCKFLWKSNAG